MKLIELPAAVKSVCSEITSELLLIQFVVLIYNKKTHLDFFV